MIIKRGDWTHILQQLQLGLNVKLKKSFKLRNFYYISRENLEIFNAVLESDTREIWKNLWPHYFRHSYEDWLLSYITLQCQFFEFFWIRNFIFILFPSSCLNTNTINYFYKQLLSGLSPQICLYFLRSLGLIVVQRLFVVWASDLCLRSTQ